MKKNIPVKYGADIIILLLIVFIPVFLSILKTPNFKGILLSLLVTVFISSILLGISYSIKGETLEIRNNFFGTTKIPVRAIKEIRKTSSLLSSPAPSIAGRIQINYDNSEIIISPRNYEAFKKEILKINPEVKFY